MESKRKSRPVPVPPAVAASPNDQPASPVNPLMVNAVLTWVASFTDGTTVLT